MYKIIGADGNEYGPITAEQLRQWIAEGRANAQTRVLLEGTSEWKPLSAFPEFMVSAPAAPPTLSSPMPVAGSNAEGLVAGPAIALIVVAVLGFLIQAARLIWLLAFSAEAVSRMQMQGQPQWANMFVSGPLVIASGVISILVSGVILLGGIKMKKLENYGLAMAASIVAMIPCISPCCIIGLPIGIWALVVLSKPEVKNAFRG
jgi:hypothetical protein